MQTRIKVIKADGSVEEYLHTKVIGSISNALARVDQADICVAEQLAEVVTYYLYSRVEQHNVASGEILSMVQAALCATGYEQAAIAMKEHHFERKLKRSRIEVVPIDVQELTDADLLAASDGLDGRCRWDKSRIVEDLVVKHHVRRQTARMIAAMVEEKIFSMGITLVPVSLIKQLVLADAAPIIRAQEQLEPA